MDARSKRRIFYHFNNYFYQMTLSIVMQLLLHAFTVYVNKISLNLEYCTEPLKLLTISSLLHKVKIIN